MVPRDVLRGLLLSTLRAAAPDADVDVRIDGRDSGTWAVHVVAERDGERHSATIPFDPQSEEPFELARAAAELAVGPSPIRDRDASK